MKGFISRDHPSANERISPRRHSLSKELNIPMIRYPGGNFVSGFLVGEDSIGPIKVTQKVDLAWRTETNEVGIHEFYNWKPHEAEINMAVNQVLWGRCS